MNLLINKIPITLLFSRLVVAFLIIILSFVHVAPLIIVSLSIYAIISDVFDGMIARKLNISTPKMRQLDTKIDTIFWFTCLFYILINNTPFFKEHIWQIGILILSEVFIILFGKIKFKERISYHTIFSKFWALSLLWLFIDSVLNSNPTISFTFSFYYGVFVQFEILVIATILKHNQTDIPFFWHAFKIRKGLSIKRNRFFNG